MRKHCFWSLNLLFYKLQDILQLIMDEFPICNYNVWYFTYFIGFGYSTEKPSHRYKNKCNSLPNVSLWWGLKMSTKNSINNAEKVTKHCSLPFFVVETSIKPPIGKLINVYSSQRQRPFSVASNGFKI